MLNVEVARWLGVIDPTRVLKAVAALVSKWRPRQRIDVPRMSDAWLREHERQSGQHPEW